MIQINNIQNIQGDLVQSSSFTISLTIQETKNLISLTFITEPEKFQSTEILMKIGFTRVQCIKHQIFYWRKIQKRELCRDSKCFVEKECGVRLKGKKLSYGQALKSFQKCLTSSQKPYTSILRYYLITRWKNDLNYLASSIFCFQLYCANGKREHPDSLLICSQFNVRLNDIDNVGLTGRNYLEFIKLGLQAFNYFEKYHFFRKQFISLNYECLIDQLEINSEQVTFIEDLWVEGGNLDPCIKCFSQGLQLGQVVFTQYKYFPDGKYEWLPTKIIYTEIGFNQQKRLLEIIERNRGTLSIDKLISSLQYWGVSFNTISNTVKVPIPSVYQQIANQSQKIYKTKQIVPYVISTFIQTQSIQFENFQQLKFQSKVVDVIDNNQKNNQSCIIVLEKSAFYPTYGAQENDIGFLNIRGEEYEVVDVQKIRKMVLDFLDKPVTKQIIGKTVMAEIDVERRKFSRVSHRAIHVVFGASQRVLGPDVCRKKAKNQISHAYLDIHHFNFMTKQQQKQIQNEANRIILQSVSINKYFMDRRIAEKQFGFKLYQGCIVPENNLRIVEIKDVDIQACCGTHCDNTSQVGWIKIFKSRRIQDSVLRLYFVAGKNVIPFLNNEITIINQLRRLWGVQQNMVVSTAKRLFKSLKKYQKEIETQRQDLIQLQAKLISNSQTQKLFIFSKQKSPTAYYLRQSRLLSALEPKKKSVVFVGEQSVFGLILDTQHLDLQAVKNHLLSAGNRQETVTRIKVSKQFSVKDKIIKSGYRFSFVGKIIAVKFAKLLKDLEFETL